MKALNDLQESIFLECKDIIHKVSQITNREEILEKSHLVSELLEKISNLKFIQSNKDFFDNILISNIETIDNDIKPEENIDDFSENLIKSEQEEIINEEEISETQEEILPELENEIVEDLDEEDETPAPEITFEIANEEEIETEIHTQNPIEEEASAEITIDIAEEEEEPMPEEEIIPVEVPHIEEITPEEEEPKEKKIKLAKIKNINHIQALFDEETMEQITERPEPKTEIKTENKTSKREFVLDLNDKIAFSKMLFGGSQTELNDVVKTLNSFENIDDAKQYLSDMYYDKGWDKVDEYAQRLWFLVENKFM